jgi:hypothetical protein
MVVELRNPVPFTVRLRDVTPATTVAGLMEVTDGEALGGVVVVVPLEPEEPPHPIKQADTPRQMERAKVI